MNYLKTPDALLLSIPYPRLVYEDNTPNIFMALNDDIEDDEEDKDPKIMQLQSVFLDLDNNEINKFEDDHRLNFFLSNIEVYINE